MLVIVRFGSNRWTMDRFSSGPNEEQRKAHPPGRVAAGRAVYRIGEGLGRYGRGGRRVMGELIRTVR